MPTQTGNLEGYSFSKLDVEELSQHGITLEDARRQLELLRSPAKYIELSRPSAVGDGIEQIQAVDHEHLIALHRQAASEQRYQKFVPASGAASRMFRELLLVLESGTPDPFEMLSAAPANSTQGYLYHFLSHLADFAFFDKLEAKLKAQNLDPFSLLAGTDYLKILAALLQENGLNYAQLPKALLDFHKYSKDDIRTPLEEHLVEAALTIRDARGICRLHFTVSPEHKTLFEVEIREKSAKIESRFECKFEITISVQKPSTETLSVCPQNRPFHDERGVLLLRPGGHGALIENLADLRGDLVFVKNIDNIQRDEDRELSVLYKQLLAGKLIEVQSQVFSHLHEIQKDPSSISVIKDASEYLRNALGISLPSTTADTSSAIIKRLNAPIRVCGVVKNSGEPGGGPFWVKDVDGATSLQIVESAQVDVNDSEQKSLFANATHFNPVDIVCGLKNFRGEHFNLYEFVDESAIIKTRKSYNGKDLISYERPGLWNGAMARWITVFVEIPAETFSPVKTVNDLLRKAHISRISPS